MDDQKARIQKLPRKLKRNLNSKLKSKLRKLLRGAFGPFALLVLLASMLCGHAALAASQDQTPQAQAPPTSPQASQSLAADAASATPETVVSPKEAKELFRSVDEILKFASDDTGLPIKHEVK